MADNLGTPENAAAIAEMEANRLKAEQNRPTAPTLPPPSVTYDGSGVGPQTLGAGSSGPVNGYGNSLDMATQMNVQAAKMKELNATPALPTPGGSSMPEAPKYNPFDRPGDGNGDAAGRASQYDNLMREAASATGITKGQRAAMMGAAQGLMAPGLAMMKQQGDDYAQKMGALNAGSLPSNIGGANVGANADVMKGLFSMFGTNQKPGETPAPWATAATTPAVPSPTATPAIGTNPQASAGANPYWKPVPDVMSAIG